VDLELDSLIVVGGDGSLTTALQLQEAGFSIIGVPKTIDNDLEATSMTFKILLRYRQPKQ
jgi:6-phosphofructokinase